MLKQKSAFRSSFRRSLLAVAALATLVSSFASSAAATQGQNAPPAASLRFKILAVQDASDPQEKAVVDLALAPENADAWSVVLDADARADGSVVDATWVPVDPAQESGVSRDNVVRDSQAKEVPGQTKPNVDVLVLDLENYLSVDSADMESVDASYDERTMAPEVHFEMTPKGAERLRDLTTAYKGRQLGVVMNDRLHGAPAIRAVIENSGSIDFGIHLAPEDYQRVKEEVDVLVAVMRGMTVEEYRAAKTGKSPWMVSIRFGVLLLAIRAIGAIVIIVLFASRSQTVPRALFQNANAPVQRAATTNQKSGQN